MSRRVLALLTLDADGTLTITAGPEPLRTPSWADKPEREITIEPERLNAPIVIHERERSAEPHALHAAPAGADLLLHSLRKLTEPARG